MIRLLYRLLSQHFSLLVIVSGAVGFFISNLVMKEVLSPTLYGHYSIVVTYFSLIYVLGILGCEQVFLRYSKPIAPNNLVTQKSQLHLVIIIMFLSAVASSLLFKHSYAEIAFDPILLFVASLSMIGLLFVFNVLRLNSNFSFAQAVSNCWKIVLFILASLFYFFGENDLGLFVDIISSSIILVFICGASYIFFRIKISFNDEFSSGQILLTAFHFFLAILSFSIITFADRFIIEMKYSFEEFGNFFYLTNFFLAPYTILQNYVGFKQLIFFKNDFNKEYFIQFNRKIIFFGAILAVLLFIAAFFLDQNNVIQLHFNDYISIIILLLITGVVRLYSSSIISAFEARTTLETLRKSNIYIFAATIAILLIAVFAVHSIEAILICVIATWFFRCMVHRKLLLFQLKNNN